MDQTRPPVPPYADTAALGPSAAINDTRDGDDDVRDELPEHEQDDDRTLGGGVMGAGGTATDRGTGTLEGEAQGPRAGQGSDPLVDDPLAGDPDENEPEDTLPATQFRA